MIFYDDGKHEALETIKFIEIRHILINHFATIYQKNALILLYSKSSL